MGLSLPVTEGAGFAETEGVGFSPGVNKPLAVTKGEREEEPSLLNRLLTFGEETEGAGFSPRVKQPLAITKGEKRRGLVSSCHPRCRLCRNRRYRFLTWGEEAEGYHQR